MKLTQTWMLAVPLCLFGACSYGLTAGKFSPASSPGAVEVRVDTGQTVFVGELLETRDAGFVVLNRLRLDRQQGGGVHDNVERRVRFLPDAIIQSLAFELEGSRRGLPRWPGADRDRFRLLSRFPQGLSPEVLQQLLAAHGQTEIAGTK